MNLKLVQDLARILSEKWYGLEKMFPTNLVNFISELLSFDRRLLEASSILSYVFSVFMNANSFIKNFSYHLQSTFLNIIENCMMRSISFSQHYIAVII